MGITWKRTRSREVITPHGSAKEAETLREYLFLQYPPTPPNAVDERPKVRVAYDAAKRRRA
jgi:hypothetical protein